MSPDPVRFPQRRTNHLDLLYADIVALQRRTLAAFVRWAQQQPGYILPGDPADIVARFQQDLTEEQ